MEYTILKLAKIANISKRTLRYYDEINLLKPKRISSSGYRRIYGREEVDILQQILFYRQFGFELTEIKDILNNTEFNKINAFREHKKSFMKKESRLIF